MHLWLLPRLIMMCLNVLVGSFILLSGFLVWLCRNKDGIVFEYVLRESFVLVFLRYLVQSLTCGEITAPDIENCLDMGVECAATHGTRLVGTHAILLAVGNCLLISFCCIWGLIL